MLCGYFEKGMCSVNRRCQVLNDAMEKRPRSTTGFKRWRDQEREMLLGGCYFLSNCWKMFAYDPDPSGGVNVPPLDRTGAPCCQYEVLSMTKRMRPERAEESYESEFGCVRTKHTGNLLWLLFTTVGNRRKIC